MNIDGPVGAAGADARGGVPLARSDARGALGGERLARAAALIPRPRHRALAGGGLLLGLVELALELLAVGVDLLLDRLFVRA